MSSLANYVIWKWLFIFGFVFWIALCSVDKLYISQGQDNQQIGEEAKVVTEPQLEVAEIPPSNQQPIVEDNPSCSKETSDLNDNIEGKKIEQSYILNAVTLVGFLIFVTVVKIRNGTGSEEEERDLKNYELMFSLIAKKDHKKFLLFNQNNSIPEETSSKEPNKETPKEIPKEPDITEEIIDNDEFKINLTKNNSLVIDEDNSLKNRLEPAPGIKSTTNLKKVKKENSAEYSEGPECCNSGNKPLVNSLCMSRPESRSMRVPTIDVQSLQEKLEKLEQSVAAMRKRRIGIVSGTKEFQRFLNELTPVC